MTQTYITLNHGVGTPVPVVHSAHGAGGDRQAQGLHAGAVAHRRRHFYPIWGDDRRSVLENEVLGRIAREHDANSAQIMWRWYVQQGRLAIPKSTNPTLVAQNRNNSGFSLPADEIRQIDALHRGVRGGPDRDAFDPST